MTDETRAKRRHFDRVAEMFSHARRIEPAQRAGYLDVECGDDTGLRAEIETLLEAHDDVPAAPLAVLPGVPGFRVLRRIGVGGMGTVYEAEQEHPRRRVALKALRLDALSDESLARFETEARALARLEHPGIARIFQAGRFEGPAGDLPYIVMELVEGRSITEHGASLGREARVELLIEVCAAVEHAHQRGILHRDLKPPNILVPADGKPRVLDFGVAREIEEPSSQTRTGHLLGTLAYMSPEQARGEFDDLDTRCDIYALGVIGYELVSGRIPHDVRSMPLLEAARVVAEQPHRSLGKDDLSLVLDKALAKDRDRRYPSASAFADDLRRVLRREPVRARAPSRLYHVRRFVQRNRAIVATVAVAVVGLIVAFLHAIGAARFARTQQEVAGRARYAAQLQAATSHLDLADVESARSLLESADERRRGWMWDHLWAVTDSDLSAWTFAGPVTLARPFDPARPRAWSGGRAHDRDGPLDFGPARGGGRAYAVSDDTWLALAGPDTVLRLRRGEAARHAFQVAPGEVLDMAFDPARSRALVASASHGGGRLVLYDTDTRRPLWSRTVPRLKRAVLSGDGRRVVAATFWNGGVLQWNAADGEPLPGWRAHTSHVTLLAQSPSTGRIATFAMDWNIRVWDRDGRLLASINDPGQWVHALAFSPDGRLLASGHPRGTVRFWEAETGRMAWAAAGTSRVPVTAIAWSADGERVTCESGDGVFLRLARPSLARDVLAHHATRADGNVYPYVYDVSFSRDGRWLASVGWDHTARICDARTGRLVRTLELLEYTEAATFGRDGLLYVVAGDRGTGAWDAATGRRTAVRDLPAVDVSAHPDGTQVAVTARGRLWRLDADSLADARPPLDVGRRLWVCAYAPDGRRIACGGMEGHVVIVAGDRVVRAWKAHDAWISSLAWSPDGRRVVAGTKKGHVSVFDAASGRREDGFLIPEARIFTLAYSPGGRSLFVGSDEHAIRVWDTEGGNGLGRLRGHDGYVKGLAFSPDGDVLASASGDNTVRLWHRQTERARR